MASTRKQSPRSGDVRHVGATKGHMGNINMPMDPSMPLPPPGIESHLQDKEEMRLRELEEARARAAQMEKTMRWWSDCTANWREKWGKVRAERNKAREEVRQLRVKLEAMVKECAALKREKQEFVTENDNLREQLDNAQNNRSVTKMERPVGERSSPVEEVPERDTNANSNHMPQSSGDSLSSEEMVFLEALSARAKQNAAQQTLPPEELSHHSSNHVNHKQHNATRMTNSSSSSRQDSEVVRNDRTRHYEGSRIGDRRSKDVPSPTDEMAGQRAFMLQMRLEEATKTIQIERQEKENLNETIEKLRMELSTVRIDHDEMREGKQQIMKELSMMRAEHQQEIGRITSDLEDETCTRFDMDKRLADMRKELERLQAENAMEWGKRERLETEKLALERENKKLKSDIEDLEEHLAKKNKQMSAGLETNVKAMQEDMMEKNKELADLKHMQGKFKKILQDKSDELEHTKRRADQHEGEVKKLRSRVEELKRDLAKAEDQVDEQSNSIRKLQRNIDETLTQNDNLTVQVEHLQARLRSQPNATALLAKRRGASHNYDTKDDPADISSDLDMI
ncbi:coiled-coil domain-containing protein 102A-like [Amphiura filiformis]|uniref:coiled-coil domain-containing protein 102A-like n=1 Tax=Amphiura filiformis TaxID=82378 RepID=UPI003B22710A